MPNFVVRRLVGGSVRLLAVLIALTVLAVSSNCGAFGDTHQRLVHGIPSAPPSPRGSV